MAIDKKDDYMLGVIYALRHIRANGQTASLHDALLLVAQTFGFPDEPWGDGLDSWRRCKEDLISKRISLTQARGPHTLTILKAIAAKHGYKNVSTQGDG